MHEQLRHPVLRVALVIAAGVVACILAVSAVAWIIGTIVHLVPLLLRLAIFIGLVAAVWWLVAGRRRPSGLR